MLMDKRKEPPTLDDAPFKRLRPDDPTHFSTTITRTIASTCPWALPLHSATTKVFQGHTAEVFTCQFSPSGHHVASAGAEKRICRFNAVPLQGHATLLDAYSAVPVDVPQEDTLTRSAALFFILHCFRSLEHFWRQ